MITLIKQRLKSKTYLAAIIAAVLTAVEAQSGLLLSLVSPEYKVWVTLVFPFLMMLLREVTTTALSDK